MTESGEAEPKARKGRPAGKRGTFTFRVTAGLRARLEADAAAVGRPVSEEIERRLERTYENEDLLLSYFGSSETLKLSQSISLLVRAVEMRTGKKWTEDAATRGHIPNAIRRFVEIYFHEQGIDTPYHMSLLGEAAAGYDAAEQVAHVMGLKSKVRDHMEEFLKTPEGQEAMARIRRREEGEAP